MRCTKNRYRELEEFASEIGYMIRYEKGNFRSASCLIKSKHLMVINKFLDLGAKAEKLIELLNTIPDIELSSMQKMKLNRWTEMLVKKEISKSGSY